VNELLLTTGDSFNILNIGIPDRYVEHGSRQDCLAMARLDTDGILEQVNKRLEITGTPRSVSGSDI
jgi:1-deoxy-D-xylulose-5-phosphate synthase